MSAADSVRAIQITRLPVKKTIFRASRIMICAAAFFDIITFVVWGSHCITEACMKMVAPEQASYLFKTCLFTGVQFLISGAIYLLFVTISHITSKSGWQLEFFPLDVNASGVMLAIIPVAAIPLISIALACASRTEIEINSIMRWSLLPTSLAIVFGSAAIEEFLFRGVLLKVLLQHSRASALICLIFQSLVFALFHGEAARISWLNFLGFSCVGLFLGLAYQASGRLWVPILLHSWSNIWSGLLAGGNNVWFAGTLFSKEMDSFMTVKRLATIGAILLLVRQIRATTGRRNAGQAARAAC